MKGKVGESMYIFIVEKKEELLQGRKINFVAKNIGLTRQRLGDILNGNKTTKKLTAHCIVKYFNPDKEIEDYFERIK